MNYKIVELKQKTVVGKSIETSNSDPKMGEQIGKLWIELYDAKNGFYGQIENKIGNAIGLYSDYVGEKYSVTVGTEVSKVEMSNSNTSQFATKTIPTGKFAKFEIHGNMVTAVANAWAAIWATPLDRTFTGDFEEYLPCDNCDHIESCNVETCNDCDINIYVAIK